jgi:hypothetical protein
MDSILDGGSNGSPAPEDLLALDIDLRLGVEVWAAASDFDDWDEVQFWTFLRFVYGRGYHHALTERQRGQLCRDHGFRVPKRAGR